MATTQIEESALAELRETAGRVHTLESERDTAVAERDAAIAERNSARADARISAIIAEAGAQFDDLQVAGLRATAPITEGALDEDAFRQSVTEAAARLAESRGAGSVQGFGSTTPPSAKTEAELREANDRERAGMFGRKIQEG